MSIKVELEFNDYELAQIGSSEAKFRDCLEHKLNLIKHQILFLWENTPE